jgi:hypothetical protein
MENAWDNPAMAAEYGLRGYQRIRERFDPAKITRQRVEFFQKVAAEARDDSRQWIALSNLQVRAVLQALVQQCNSTLGLQPESASPGEMLLARFRSLAEKLNRPPVVWLFGAGRFTARLLSQKHLWESAGFSVAGIVDEHPRFQQTPTYLGLNVLNPQQLCERINVNQKVDAIILSTDTLEEVFRQRAEPFPSLGVQVLALSD